MAASEAKDAMKFGYINAASSLLGGTARAYGASDMSRSGQGGPNA